MHTEPKHPGLRGVIIALVTVVFLIPAVYVLAQVYLALRRVYRTETAISYTLADSITLNGAAVFESVPVPGGGSLGYLVADGERVTGGTVLAEVYTNAEQGRQREQLDRLLDRMTLLERSQSAAGSDIAQLGTQTRQALYDLLDELDTGLYGSTAAAGDDFLLAQNRLQLRTGQTVDFSASIAALQEQQASIEQTLSGLETITASTNGYFVSAARSAGLALDKETADAMSAAGLQTQLAQGIPAAEDGSAGRIVTGFTWWFYTVVQPEDLPRFEGLNTVSISVPGKQETPLTASIVSLEPDEEGGPAKLVLECQSINADVLSLGQENARIDLHSYTGLRIDKNATHFKDGERGVYVKYGGLTRFKRITILYENENYILVPPDGAPDTENELRLYDEIIVEGTNLQDNRLL